MQTWLHSSHFTFKLCLELCLQVLPQWKSQHSCKSLQTYHSAVVHFSSPATEFSVVYQVIIWSMRALEHTDRYNTCTFQKCIYSFCKKIYLHQGAHIFIFTIGCTHTNTLLLLHSSIYTHLIQKCLFYFSLLGKCSKFSNVSFQTS